MGAEKPPGNKAKQEPQCQRVVQDGVNAWVSSYPMHPTPGDERGYAASLPPCLTTNVWVAVVLLGVHASPAFTTDGAIQTQTSLEEV